MKYISIHLISSLQQKAKQKQNLQTTKSIMISPTIELETQEILQNPKQKPVKLGKIVAAKKHMQTNRKLFPKNLTQNLRCKIRNPEHSNLTRKASQRSNGESYLSAFANHHCKELRTTRSGWISQSSEIRAFG